jgi:hypothetical protein
MCLQERALEILEILSLNLTPMDKRGFPEETPEVNAKPAHVRISGCGRQPSRQREGLSQRQGGVRECHGFWNASCAGEEERWLQTLRMKIINRKMNRKGQS